MTRLSELMAPVFHGVHADVVRGGHREYWMKGGRGSAKSSFVSLEIVLGLLREPDANAIVFRKVAGTLRESVYEQMIWAIGMLGLEGHFRYRLAPLEIVYAPTGQRILFRGADDPEKAKSIKLAKGRFGFVWFEELAEFAGMEDIRTIKASVVRGGKTVTFCSYNPPASRRHWVNREARVVRADRLVHESCYLDLPEDWLGGDFIAEAEQVRQSSERLWRQMYRGEVTGCGGQVFENVVLRALSDEEVAAGRTYNGLDFGFAVDPDAFVRVGYDPKRRKIWLLEEFWGVRTPVDRLAGELKRRAGGEVVRCDSAEPRLIAQLREKGIMAVGVKKGAGSVAAGIRWLQECGEIAIDPARCPNAAREFEEYEYPIGPDGELLPEFPDRNNHMIDAVRYAMEGVSSAKAARTMGMDEERARARGRFF